MGLPIPMTADGPPLEPVFGRLPAEEQEQLRAQLLDAEARRLELQRRFTGGPSAWFPGVELVVYDSGEGHLQTCAGGMAATGGAVQFEVNLYRGAVFGPPRTIPTWTIDVTVYVDCMHEVDHETMDYVYSDVTLADSPAEAVETYSDKIDEVISLAAEHPLEYWAAMGRD